MAMTNAAVGIAPMAVIPAETDIGLGFRVSTRALLALRAVVRMTPDEGPVELSASSLASSLNVSQSTARRWAELAERAGWLEHELAYLADGGHLGRIYTVTGKGRAVLEWQERVGGGRAAKGRHSREGMGHVG